MTRFTKYAARLTVALALSLLCVRQASADHGRRPSGSYEGYGSQRHRANVDIRSLEAAYTPRGFSSGVEVSYRVRAEDVRRGQSFNLQLSLIDCGRTVQTIVVPLNRGVSCGRDEIEFRGCVTIPAGRGFGRGSGRMSLAASVIDACSGRLLETEETSIRFCGPESRSWGARGYEDRTGGHDSRGYDDRNRGHDFRGQRWEE